MNTVNKLESETCAIFILSINFMKNNSSIEAIKIYHTILSTKYSSKEKYRPSQNLKRSSTRPLETKPFHTNSGFSIP